MFFEKWGRRCFRCLSPSSLSTILGASVHFIVHFDRSPNQGALEEIDYRKAIVIVVVAGGAELAVATAKDLRLLQEEHVAHGVADPKRGIGIDVHRGGWNFCNKS